MTAFVKFVLHSIDLQSEDPWENKSMYVKIHFQINLLIVNFKVYAVFGLGYESDASYSLFDLYWYNVQNPYIAYFRSPSDVSCHTEIPKEFI